MTILIKTKNIPILRFAGFFGEWNKNKLGEIAEVKRGLASQQLIYTSDSNNGVRLLRINDFLSDNPVFIKETEDTKILKVKTNDLLIAGTGATAGIIFIVPEEFNDMPFSYNAPRIRVNSANYLFVYYYLKSNNILRQQKKLFVGNAQPFLDTDSMRGFRINTPQPEEQLKIAEFLGSVDEWIENLREQKKSFEFYKKGMMQKIFSQEIRFKDKSGKNFHNWEKKTLGDVGKTYNGLTGKAGEDFGSGEEFITYKQIFDSSEIDIKKFSLVKVDTNEKQSKAKFGDIFFTTSSETPHEVGFSSVLLNKGVSPYLNSFSFGIRPNSLNKLDPYFSKFFFRSSVFRKEAMKLAQGSTRYNISKIGFMKIKIMLPSFLEQQKIAEFLTSIDNLVESKQQQISQAEQWKKGLMQRLFV